MGVPNQFIEKLLPKMMDDLLSIVIDPYYPPETTPESNCHFLILNRLQNS